MRKSKRSAKKIALQCQTQQALRRLKQLIDGARACPNRFISFCITDGQAERLRQAIVHQELQSFLTEHQYAVVELPRDHGKSVQLCARILWELGREPSLRIKMICATDALAAERTRYLREQIEENQRLRLVFPELQPSQPWSVEAFTVVRPAQVIGPSVAAFGVGSGSTGTRADLLICDDIVDVRALTSAAERRRVTAYFHENLLNLLEPEGRCWNLCTPWHADDVNAHLKQNAAFRVFRRAVGPNLEPVWPEKWPTEKLEARRQAIGELSFARGYRLQTWDEQHLLMPPERLHYWREELPRHAYERVVLAVDPAVALEAQADASALVVVGRLATGTAMHILQAQAFRISVVHLVERIDAWYRQWQPDVIVFESNAAFAGIRDLMQHHTRFGASVRGLTQSRSKSSRIAALSVPVENGALRFRGDAQGVHASQWELWHEVTQYPMAAHDDLVDALAMATDQLLHHGEPRLWLL